MSDSLAEACYIKLREAIICGVLGPGEKLRITKLKEMLQTGPTPIREALSRLTATGLVIAESNRGFYVRAISKEEIKDIYATFEKIELMALNQAIELGDTAWEGKILASLHQLSAVENGPSPINIEEWLQLNHVFHMALISGCQSPTLMKVREDVYQLFDRYCHLSLMASLNGIQANNELHCKLAQAVISRNFPEACKLMQEHLKGSYEAVIKKLFN